MRVERPGRVLHVEDDDGFAELTRRFLKRTGDFEISSETDPEAALDRLDGGEFDCVVSDYDMPGMDGLELLEAVRAEYSELPFILFTGKGSEEVASRAISTGVTDYLQKRGTSETFELLANRIESAITTRRTRAELRAQRRLSERIVRSNPIATVVHDLDGSVLLANERANEILGTDEWELDADEYEAASWGLRDENGEAITFETLPYSRVVAGEELREERYSVHTDDGDVKEIVVYGAPLHDGDGTVEAAIISFRLATDAA